MFNKLRNIFKKEKSSPSYPRLPVLKENGESNIAGLYLVGDVAGTPLVKVGLNAGYKLASLLAHKLEEVKGKNEYDVVIAGAGVSGLATALSLKEKGYNVLAIDSGKTYQLLRNFTKGKVLYSEPASLQVMGLLPFKEDDTENVINAFEKIIAEKQVAYNENEKIINIKKTAEGFTTLSEKSEYKSTYVVLAVGKAGNPRKAGVKGESTYPDKVFHALKDPEDFKDKKILVYGGGDVAVEAANALADAIGKSVVLAYRGEEFTRPQKRNLEVLLANEKIGKVKVCLNTVIAEIKADEVIIENTQTGQREALQNDYVFEMLGSVEPGGFFKKIGIKSEFAWDFKRIMTLVFSATVVYLLYSWKKGYAPFSASGAGINNLPSIFKNTSFWYSALYTVLMLFFGLKAMKRWSKRGTDKYQIYRFASLIVFQLLSFILIECIFAVFLPGNTWWRAYAINNPFPLLFDSFYNMSGVSVNDLRWLFVGLGFLMTFLVIPIAVRQHGKRFCTWICGCGGLAETFGDRWRHHSPKGERSRTLEHMGDFVLFWAFITAGVILFYYNGDTTASGKWHGAYSVIADFCLVAVIPVSLYPIWGGKIWCRYWCPLAKYMQLLSRWYGRLQISSNEHCIQCTKCSRYCQVGVDVMSFAKNQEPFSNKNSSCIHCGICITVCPMKVLKFELENTKGSV